MTPTTRGGVSERAATTQERRERAFFRRQRQRDAASVVRVGEPYDPKAARRRYDAHVADLIATFCPHDPTCETFGSVTCPEGFEAANAAINGEFVRRNRLAVEIEGRRSHGNPLGRPVVYAHDDPEGQRLTAERDARLARQQERDGLGVEDDLAELAGMLAGGAS